MAKIILFKETGTIGVKLLHRVMLLGLIALIATIIAIGTRLWISFQHVQVQLDRTSFGAKQIFEQFIDNIASDLVATSAALAVTDKSNDILRRTLERQPAIVELDVIDPQGHVLAGYHRADQSRPTMLSEQPWLTTVQAGQTYVGLVELKTFGLPSIDLAVALSDEANNFLATLRARLDLTTLASKVITLKVGDYDSGYVYITDDAGQLLAYRDLQLLQNQATLNELVGRMPQTITGSGFNIYRGIEGKNVLASGVSFEVTPWFIIVEQPLHEVFWPLIPQLIGLLAALSTVFIIVYNMLDFIRRQIVLPLRLLRQGIKIFTTENLKHHIDIQAKDEFGALATAFNRMATRLAETIETLEQRLVELRRAQEALRESEARYRSIFEHAAEGIFRSASGGCFTDVNPALVYMLGYQSVTEVLALKIPEDLYVDLTQHDYLQDLYRVEDVVRNFELVFKKKNGEHILISLNARVERDGQGKILFYEGITQDITERKLAEVALQASEYKYRMLIENMNEGLIQIDKHGLIQFVNNRYCEIVGYSREELIGSEVSSLLFDEDQQRVIREKIQRRREGAGDQYEIQLRRKSKELIWTLVSGTPIQDENGKVIGSLGIVTDITNRKQADDILQKYTAELERSNRELQNFAYVASHDLQEPLRKIQTFGDRLKHKYHHKFDKQGQDYLTRMQNAAIRMQTLIQDLLAFSRVATKAQPFTVVSLNEVIHGVLSDLETLIEKASGQVEVGELPTIEADRTQMRQLFQNLIGNALKFHRDDQAPLVTVRSQPLSQPGQLCQIVVEDNGIGFDEKYLDRIFNVFQRLHGHSAYEGSGVGLAICRKIVERHGGNITAKSVVGQGATFIVTLPIKQ